VFSFADVVHLLANELSGLRAGRLPFPRIFASSFQRFLVWHVSLLLWNIPRSMPILPSMACCNFRQRFPYIETDRKGEVPRSVERKEVVVTS
jgi:hypothetical protein